MLRRTSPFLLFQGRQHSNNNELLKRLHLSLSNIKRGLAVDKIELDRLVQDLEIGPAAVARWRRAVRDYNSSKISSSLLARRSDTNHNDSGRTHEEEHQEQHQIAVDHFIASAIQDLAIVLSPCVSATYGKMSSVGNTPPPVASSHNITNGFMLTARRDIQPGMFLVSVPTGRGVLRADTNIQTSTGGAYRSEEDHQDSVTSFLQGVESLSVPLLRSLADETDRFHKYAHFLRDHVTVPGNLPYLSHSIKRNSEDAQSCYRPVSLLAHNLLSEFERRVSMHHAAAAFHQQPAATSNDNNHAPSPLAGVAEHHQRWAASMVLSRRIGGNCLVPVVDLINHSSTRCNAFYTMCDRSSMTGIDLVDNLFAGVEDLEEPHLHVFAINRIRKGEQITMSYSDVDPAEEDVVSSEEESGDQPPHRRSRRSATASPLLLDDDGREADHQQKQQQQQQQQDDDDDNNNNKNAGGDAVVVDSGRDMWNLLYGFVPPEGKTDSPLRSLQQVAEVVARSRVMRRQEIFPTTGVAGKL